ncbi:hypothetical protein B0H13DRAFT_1925828 [Mycena leptocephala]|nr:hypothetical protein B0H13DRAFT_1925828 [Mycena leptocephala]
MASRLSIGRRRWGWRCNREWQWEWKRERGCADGASRLALHRADADDARMTPQRRRWLNWMIRSICPRLGRSLNPPLAICYRSSALAARHSAPQTGFSPWIGVGVPFTPLEIAITVIFPSTRDVSRAPLPMALYEHQASETAADGDSLVGLLDGAVSDQAPDAVCSPNWGPSWSWAMARASMRLGASASDARGIRAGGGNVAAALGLWMAVSALSGLLPPLILHAGTFLADAGFLAPGNLYGSKSENYYLDSEPASNRSKGT